MNLKTQKLWKGSKKNGRRRRKEVHNAKDFVGSADTTSIPTPFVEITIPQSLWKWYTLTNHAILISRNIKLAPCKFQIGQCITYGGPVLEGSKQKGDKDLSVNISPTQEKQDAFLDFKTPTCKKDIQSICRMAA